MSITPGFQRSRREQSRRRESSSELAASPSNYELTRFGSPLKELGADKSAYTEEIGRLWSEAQDKFLKIGRYLVKAKELLPHGSYEAMVVDELPFGRHVAWQLRTVAMAVDGGRLIEDDLPNSYATAFKLASLDDDVLKRAKVENIIRPNVTRAEVVSFVRRVAGERNKQPANHDYLKIEMKALQQKLRKLVSEQRATQTRLSEISAELGIQLPNDR